MSNPQRNDRWHIDTSELESILDRTISFVGNCDSKATTILGIYGVVTAIIFSDGGILSFKCIIKEAISNKNILYILLVCVSLVVVGIGLCFLLLVLTARIDCKKYKDNCTTNESNIFWGGIVKQNAFKDYRKELNNLSENSYKNDIMTQIYFNSHICNKKFKYYNRGLWISATGFILLIIFWGVGAVIY